MMVTSVHVDETLSLLYLFILCAVAKHYVCSVHQMSGVIKSGGNSGDYFHSFPDGKYTMLFETSVVPVSYRKPEDEVGKRRGHVCGLCF